MSWLKEKLQDWLEIKVQHQCSHQWEILETKKVEVLFQFNTKYIMKCTKCGELQAKTL